MHRICLTLVPAPTWHSRLDWVRIGTYGGILLGDLLFWGAVVYSIYERWAR